MYRDIVQIDNSDCYVLIMNTMLCTMYHYACQFQVLYSTLQASRSPLKSTGFNLLVST